MLRFVEKAQQNRNIATKSATNYKTPGHSLDAVKNIRLL